MGTTREATNGSKRCPYCKRNILINRDGKLRKHRTGPDFTSPQCDGNGLTVEEWGFTRKRK